MRLICGKRCTVNREECGNGKAKGAGGVEGRQEVTREERQNEREIWMNRCGDMGKEEEA